MACGKKKSEHKSNIETKSIKALKMVQIRKTKKKVKKVNICINRCEICAQNTQITAILFLPGPQVSPDE